MPYPLAEIVESPFLQLEYANPDSRDQDTWIAEARDRPASTRATISGQYMEALKLRFYCYRQTAFCPETFVIYGCRGVKKNIKKGGGSGATPTESMFLDEG